jgi:hypothetical protein
LLNQLLDVFKSFQERKVKYIGRAVDLEDVRLLQLNKPQTSKKGLALENASPLPYIVRTMMSSRERLGT